MMELRKSRADAGQGVRPRQEEERVPRVTFTVRGGSVFAAADWEPGGDLSMFAEMLRRLQAGDFAGLVNKALDEAAARNGDPSEASSVKQLLDAALARPAGPVVDPEHAFRHLARHTA